VTLTMSVPLSSGVNTMDGSVPDAKTVPFRDTVHAKRKKSALFGLRGCTAEADTMTGALSPTTLPGGRPLMLAVGGVYATVILNVRVVWWPAASVAVTVTTVVPTGNSDPWAGE